eukprot:11155132-Lingulodinium_polyedra.AAC.1
MPSHGGRSGIGCALSGMDGRPGHCLRTHAWTHPSQSAGQQHAGHTGSQQEPSPPLGRSSE